MLGSEGPLPPLGAFLNFNIFNSSEITDSTGPGCGRIEVNAEGRLMSAPKQTLSHLPLALVPSEAMQKRAEKYQFLFPFHEAASLCGLDPLKF